MSQTSLSRRELLASAAGAILLPLSANAAAVANPRGKLGIGIAAAGFGQRIRANTAAKVDMVDWAHENGYGSLESRLPPTGPDAAHRLHDKLESLSMRMIFNIPLPAADADIPAFDANIKAAHESGVYCLRAALTQRRYEQFSDFPTFWKNFETIKATVARAEPTLAKYKVKLALENHKGWRSLEHAAWLKQLSSPWVGVLFDFGNNISLCEHPEETMNNLMPYIFACHIKTCRWNPMKTASCCPKSLSETACSI